MFLNNKPYTKFSYKLKKFNLVSEGNRFEVSIIYFYHEALAFNWFTLSTIHIRWVK